VPVGAGRRFSLDFRSGGRIIANKRRTWWKFKSCATQLHSREKSEAAFLERVRLGEPSVSALFATLVAFSYS
jgi:hypothetical protein